jgi:hypothetical protein
MDEAARKNGDCIHPLAGTSNLTAESQVSVVTYPSPGLRPPSPHKTGEGVIEFDRIVNLVAC